MYISARALSKGGMVPYSGKFLRAQIFANQYARKKIRDFYFRDKVTISDHTTISRMEIVTLSVYFSIKTTDVSTLIKACRSLSAKNCHAKGWELTLRIYLQLGWWQASIVGREKFPQFARTMDNIVRGVLSSMLDGSRTIFLSIYWICSSTWTHCMCSASRSSARQQEIFGRNFRGNKFSWAGVWLRKSRKFPAIRYLHSHSLTTHGQ